MWMRTSVPAIRAILTDQRMTSDVKESLHCPRSALRKKHGSSRERLPLTFAIAPAQR